MTALERLAEWRQSDIITEQQYGILSTLVSRERFSVFLELNALLYIGVLSLVAGLGWTIRTYFTNLGDIFIIAVLSVLVAGSLYYCFSRAQVYSTGEVESADFILDYVLYLACLLIGIELGYIEFRFEWLTDSWDLYLFFSSAVFFILAYRFDNRFVLSLGLSTFAAWCGVKVSQTTFVSTEYLRISALAYGAIVVVVGVFLHRQGIKKHFLETYLHVAANVVFIALVSGVPGESGIAYLIALLVLAAISIVPGIRFRRFAFVAYGTVFGYIGVSIKVISEVRELSSQLAYLVVSGSVVIIALVRLARMFGREE